MLLRLPTLMRLTAGAGLVLLSYYVGKQVGRMEPIREDLKRRRDAEAPDPYEVPPGQDVRPTADDSEGRGAGVGTVRNYDRD